MTITANVELTESFDDNGFSRSLEQIAKLIKTESTRGVDRSVYFVEQCCYDHHSNLKSNLEQEFEELDSGLDTFWKEMKAQGNEDNVILVAVSDFARTLTPNSSAGSDHAWGVFIILNFIFDVLLIFFMLFHKRRKLLHDWGERERWKDCRQLANRL